MKLLLEERTDISVNDASAALALATRKGHTECKELILSKKLGIPPNPIDWPLHITFLQILTIIVVLFVCLGLVRTI